MQCEYMLFSKSFVFFSKSIATGDMCMRTNVKQYEIRAEENYAPTSNWVGKHAYDSLLCHNDTGWNPPIHAQTQF